MKLACVSDTHGTLPKKPTEKVDFFIHSGDLTGHSSLGKGVCTSSDFDFQVKQLFEVFIPFFKSLDCPVVFIGGNHDNMLFFGHKKVKQFWYYRFHVENELKKALAGSNVHYLKNEAKTINGVKFYGSPMVPWIADRWAFQYPRYSPTEFAEQHFSNVPEDTDILVSHGPAAGILDSNGQEKHYGCNVLNKYCQWQWNLRAMVAGHSHCRGTEKHGNTVFVNGAISGSADVSNSCNKDGNPYNIQSLDPIVVEV